MKKNNIDHSTHDFRHGAITNMVKNGMDVKEV
jgi:hypothetical protein